MSVTYTLVITLDLEADNPEEAEQVFRDSFAEFDLFSAELFSSDQHLKTLEQP